MARSITSLSKIMLKALALSRVASASSILFQQATIIGWSESDESLEITHNGSLFIENDLVTGIYSHGEELSSLIQHDTEVINAAGKIISPGFVDTHRHNWQTIWRGVKSQHAIWDHFVNSMNPAILEGLEPDDIYNACLMSTIEGLDVGVTTQLDHAHHPPSKERAEACVRASLDGGARVFHAYTIGTTGFEYSIEQQTNEFKELLSSYQERLNNSTVEVGIGCDAFTSRTAEQLEPILSVLRNSSIPFLTTHMLSGPYGVDNRPEILHNLGLLNTSMPVVLSHGSFLDHSSYNLLKSTNQYVSIALESEMSFAQTNPTAHLWLDQSALGIDGLFTFSGDLLTQARMLLQYVRHFIYTEVLAKWVIPANAPMTPHQAFLIATRNGGLALRRPDLGIIAPGSKADIIVWDTTNLAMLGWVDPVMAVLMHANVGNIQDVLVDGVFKKRDGKLLSPKLQSAKEGFLESSDRVRKSSLAVARIEVTENTTFSSGASVQVVPFVDVQRGDGNGVSYIERNV